MDSFINAKRTKNKKPDSIANSEQNYFEQHGSQAQDFDYNSEPIYSGVKPIKPKAIITLNIGDSLEQIKVFEGQDLYEISRDFALKHDLNEDFINFLVDNIRKQMQSYDKKANNKSFMSNLDQQQSRTNNEPEPVSRQKSEKELHYENWQKILKEKMGGTNKNTSNALNTTNKSIMTNREQKTPGNSPPRQRSVSPIRGENSKLTEKLFNESKIMKIKQINSEKMKEEAELRNCSFKPQISENSKRIIQRDKSNKSIHEKLYEETSMIIEKKERERKDIIAKNYPFKPNVSPLKGTQKINPKNQQELTARLLNSKKETEKVVFNMRKKEINDNTNNSFVPKISKDKYYQKAKEKEEVELENYRNKSSNNDKTEKKEKIDRKADKIEKVQIPPKPQEKPNKMTNIFDEYLNILKSIFNGMDDDCDGIISSDKIDLSKIDPDFLEIIQDILLRVDEESSWLDFQKFLDQIEENHLEVKIHNWMSKNYSNFQKLDSMYENMTPKHIQQFSFGGLDPAFDIYSQEIQNMGKNQDKSPMNNERSTLNQNNKKNNGNNVKIGEFTSRYKNLVKNFD